VSQTLKWRPRWQSGDTLSDQLKYALRKRYTQGINGYMDEDEVSYLRGLVDGGVEDAQKLIDAIEKHGDIEVFEE
jgi:hypothetical protein